MNFRTPKYVILGLIFSFFLGQSVHAALYINEILTANHSDSYDIHFYNFSDWIEIYNDSSRSVNLIGYTITDDINVPDKYLIDFSFRIEASSYEVIWADKENWYPHTNFGLDNEGEFVALFDPDGVLVDSFSFGQQVADVSYGRYPDGSNNFCFMQEPSRGQKNKPGIPDRTKVSDSVIFSQKGGFYDGTQMLELSCSSPSAKIRYTNDGSWPDENSELYEWPIKISSSKVIRARAYDSGKLPGPLATESYLIDQESTLPVLSLSTNSKYFFNYGIGIYVVGENGIKGNCIDSAVNFNQPWERAVNLEYYTPDGVCQVNQVLGARIAGRCSRTRPMKPMALISRDKYGKKGIGEYQFFNSKNLDAPKSLYLRNSGTEAYSTYLRDGFMQTLVMDRMDLDYQAYQPLVLYINGKYWGIHNLREKMDEHYVESNYGVDPDSIDLLEYNTIGTRDTHQGDWDLYEDFLAYVTDKDLSLPENYEYVKSQMDVDEFMNIHIANIYFENEDWPNNNNKFWRKRSPDGKWRWYMYDLDFGFGYWPKTGNSVDWFFDNREDSRIAYKLKSNADFRSEFVQRLASHLNTTFQTDRVLSILDSISGNIAGEMENHIHRWGVPYALSKWEKNVLEMVDFAQERQEVVIPQVIEEFDLSGTFQLELINQHPDLGSIEIAGVDIPPDFEGFYFKGAPVRIRAFPKFGYTFSRWSGDTSSVQEEIFIDASTNMSLMASFKPEEPKSALYINEFIAGNTLGARDENEAFEDWIEIYNDNDFPVDLAGLFLSDSSGKLNLSQIPLDDPDKTTVPAKGFVVFWADGEKDDGSLHLDFKLRKSGEGIFLSQQSGEKLHIIDSINFEKQYSNVSFGRSPIDPEQWIFLDPTPGAENREKRLENIFINEFMASNRSVLQDEDGNFDDWIEIYNANDFPVDLAGMFISDDPEDLTKFRISDSSSDSTRVPAGGFLVLWADDSTEQGWQHLNFALDGGGEQILIVQANGVEIIDSLTYPKLISDAPFGRVPDGVGPFSYLLATPGASNHQPDYSGLYINELMASNDGVLADQYGEYDDWIEIYNSREMPVDVGGLFLSDSAAYRTMFRISTAFPDSTTIPSRGYLLIWADDSTEQGILHTNFRLNGEGEQILLSSTTAGTIIDSLSYGVQKKDLSFGRSYDASPRLGRQLPTPLSANYLRSYDGIRISEILVSDQSLFPDEHGEYDDWIELYNSTDTTIDIAGLMINDSLEQEEKYVIPGAYPELTRIPPHDYILLWADDSVEQGPLHLPFRLRENGEQLGIYSTDGKLMDSLCYPKQSDHFSYARLEDNVWMKLPPSPGEKNHVDSIKNLYINEYMTDNENRLMDEFGEYNDWIEIYNDNTYPVNLAGLYLSDSLAIPDKYRIPGKNPEGTIVEAKGYAIIWTDGHSEQGPLHTNFRLSRSGEEVILSSYDYRQLIDSVSFSRQHSNFANGRLNDHGPWMDLPPTPGAKNVKPDLSHLFINEIMTMNMGLIADNYGEFDDWIELYNGGPDPVDLGGLFIADSIGDPDPFRISSDFPDSTTIGPGQYMLLWADDSTEQGILHTNFKLSRAGEQVALFEYDGRSLIDSVTYELVPRYQSYGRSSDGNLPWVDLATPSPMNKNTVTVISGQEEVVEVSRPKIYPNPTSGEVTLSMTIQSDTEVSLKVFDRSGKLVSLPLDAFFEAGDYRIPWKLENSSGSPLGTGLYFYVIRTRDKIHTGKLVVIKNL